MKKSNSLKAFIFVVGLGSLSACGGGPKDGYDRDLNRKTAGAAVISAGAKMCGVGGIEQYRQSFINTMRQQREVSAAAETKIREMFARADRDFPNQFPDDAARQNQCATYGTGADSIRRGIAGDFSGQI